MASTPLVIFSIEFSNAAVWMRWRLKCLWNCQNKHLALADINDGWATQVELGDCRVRWVALQRGVSTISWMDLCNAFSSSHFCVLAGWSYFRWLTSNSSWSLIIQKWQRCNSSTAASILVARFSLPFVFPSHSNSFLAFLGRQCPKRQVVLPNTAFVPGCSWHQLPVLPHGQKLIVPVLLVQWGYSQPVGFPKKCKSINQHDIIFCHFGLLSHHVEYWEEYFVKIARKFEGKVGKLWHKRCFLVLVLFTKLSPNLVYYEIIYQSCLTNHVFV